MRERTGAKRWLIAHGERVRPLRPVYLGDALFSSQPMAASVLATGADFLFACKKDSHKTLYGPVDGAPLNGRRRDRTQARQSQPDLSLPLDRGGSAGDGKDAMNVNWLGVSIVDAEGKTTYDGAFVDQSDGRSQSVVEIAACARARWKIENESFNVLKTNGYNLAHNFGYGQKYLARIFATMNLLAFAFHTACDCLETLWQQAREAIGNRSRFFQDLRAISAYIVFPPWATLMTALVSGKAPPI